MKIEVNKSYYNNNGQKVDICGSFVHDNKKKFLGVTTNIKKDEQYGQVFDEDGNWLDDEDDNICTPAQVNGYRIVSEYRELYNKEFYIHTSISPYHNVENFSNSSVGWTKSNTLQEAKREGRSYSRYYKVTIEEQL